MSSPARPPAGRPRHPPAPPGSLNDWYLAPDGRVRAVLKVRRGTVQEVGIANPGLTTSRRATARFPPQLSVQIMKM
jgi:hypothetical protein